MHSVQEKYGPVDMNMLNREFTVPWTANLGCSIALLLNPQGLQAKLMISHGESSHCSVACVLIVAVDLSMGRGQ